MTATRRTPGRTWFGGTLLVVGCVACHAPDVVIVGGLREVTALRAIPNRELDILFVIDNSPSMAGKQASLAASLSRMIDPLTRLDGGMPNLHLGVITSDMGTLGSAVAEPGPLVGSLGMGGCRDRGDDGALQTRNAPELTDGFVRDVADASGARVRNYEGELGDVMARLVQVGAGGCGFEQPLAAMRRALVNPVNAAFFRAEANLAVVFLGDEDDCSIRDPALFGTDEALGPQTSFRCFEHGVVCAPDAPRNAGDKQQCAPRPPDPDGAPLVEPIDAFVDALLAAKADPRQVMVAAIVGDPAPVAVRLVASPDRSAMVPALAPSCHFPGATTEETADPAVRLAAFVEQFAGRSQLTSICGQDLGASLDAIGATARQLVGEPCVDTAPLIDTSPAPGVQPACEVTLVRDAQPDRPSILEPCGSAEALDCYTLERDAAACPSGDQLRIRLQRPAGVAADSWLHVGCQRQL